MDGVKFSDIARIHRIESGNCNQLKQVGLAGSRCPIISVEFRTQEQVQRVLKLHGEEISRRIPRNWGFSSPGIKGKENCLNFHVHDSFDDYITCYQIFKSVLGSQVHSQ